MNIVLAAVILSWVTAAVPVLIGSVVAVAMRLR